MSIRDQPYIPAKVAAAGARYKSAVGKERARRNVEYRAGRIKPAEYFGWLKAHNFS